MMFYMTHIPKQEIILSGKTKTETGIISAAVKKWTYKPDERHNFEGGTQLSIDINNQSKDTLSLTEYVITKTDGEEIRVKFSDLEPSITSTTGERLFEAKSFTFFNIEPEPLLSLIQSGQIDNLTLVFNESKVILKPK